MAGDDLVSVAAPAKINLYLKVTGRREDGYHLLQTLMLKIDLADSLVLRKKKSGVVLSCPGSGLPTGDGNIVYRAAQLFFATFSDRLADSRAGVDIVLNKSIPVAAGLGGGSSDAGATLCGLNRLYGAPGSAADLLAIARRLGADVPQFVVDWPMVWATGIGDRIEPAKPLAGFRILVVNPGMPVATGWVYEKFALTAGINNNNLKNSQKESVAQGKSVSVYAGRPIRPDELVNDLERVTARTYPVIDSLKKMLLAKGAAAALMSGSGPTVFGLFSLNCGRQAADCYEELKKEYGTTYLVDPWC